jgi:TolB protein
MTNVTGTTGIEEQPAWASNGTIFFVKSPSAGAQIFAMNANGANQHAIENDPHIDERPVPSPDGSMVAWVSYRDGNAEIYVANADGTNATRVTNNAAKDLAPRWRPCPH